MSVAANHPTRATNQAINGTHVFVTGRFRVHRMPVCKLLMRAGADVPLDVAMRRTVRWYEAGAEPAWDPEP
jgi:hypothetical protein